MRGKYDGSKRSWRKRNCAYADVPAYHTGCDARHRFRFADHSVRLTHESRLSNLSGTKLDRGYLTTQVVALCRRRVVHWTDG